ncbi:ABC transporter ATP-binding protein [Streptomyces stelliscabiei]|uniref:Peptide/nickel transport system ATP-binding protein n=3 Tax=Streptomyces stelliscabiei TaxID=146820 RepID=A0A8I0PEB6_9ACTN|nr:ABC transporter ATP-binding protein [Streptomyces stelliscabiei]KND42992.1 ABC transporter ATP-binding protein [Streptomyces stelliscabiei]MBE1602537.1 peptide/nickel transport system ATP-binding protein [Streptomyces stelliscabiei]MDX2516757.1 ABC transporter ATP-binding protein [Streptomyces stelliscabiei]
MSHTRDRYAHTETPPGDDSPAVKVTDLTVAAPDGRHLLRDASLTVHPGRLVALTGPSGAGKTTLLRALTGLLPPGTTRTGGRVDVLGHDVFALTDRELRTLRGTRLAYVGQDPGSGLNPRMRVRTLVRELAADRGPEAVTALLAEVRLPDDGRLTSRRPGTLSGGQQRRVALARALARRPDVLLLDEPTAGLHPELRDEIAELLRHLAREHHLAIALSCHDPAVVERFADDVVELGPRPAPRLPMPVPAPATRTAALATRTAPAAPASQPALDVRNLHVAFGGTPALTGVDLTVASGAAVGIVGVSGSGKTTLVRTVVGLQRGTAGTIHLAGTPLSTGLRGRTREQRRQLQLVTQNPLGALNPSRSVADTVGRPLRLHRRCPSAGIDERVTHLLKQVGLSAAFAGRYPHELSGGQRQRVAIARALAAEPEVLICDEVTSALDADTGRAIMDLLADLRERSGTTLVLISHDLPLIADRTSTVTVLEAGRVVESGPTAEVFTMPRHAATKALLGAAVPATGP